MKEKEQTEEQAELKVHTDARDARVKQVKSNIAKAQVARDAQAVTGLVEAPGAKSDRLVDEAEDLAEANNLNVIEPFSIDSNNIQMNIIADKTNEIIDYLNEIAPQPSVVSAPVVGEGSTVGVVSGAVNTASVA